MKSLSNGSNKSRTDLELIMALCIEHAIKIQEFKYLCNTEISTFASSWGSNDEARLNHSSTADPQSDNEKTIETLYEINQVRNLGDRGHLQWLSSRDGRFISGDQLKSSKQKVTSLWSTFNRQIIWIKRQKLVALWLCACTQNQVCELYNYCKYLN